MSAGHSHEHVGHGHAHTPSADSLAGSPKARRALAFALVLGLIILTLELIAGILFGSLALLGDAAHMVTDVGAYAIALWAAHVARRPPSATRTFGHGRVEILAALANGATLLAASAWILIESIRRLIDPVEVDGAGMSVVAGIGLVANVLVVFVLLRSASSSLNMRGALLHAVGDLLGSVAALTAGIVIAQTGWERADPLASLLLTALIIVGAWRLVRASADILLERAPVGMDAEQVSAVLLAVDGAIEVHDVHVWTMSPGHTAVSAHVRLAGGIDPGDALDAMQAALEQQLHVVHSTLQLRVDRGSLPVETVPLMAVADAVEWATDHVARSNPDLSRSVIAAAAGAATIGLSGSDRISPVAVSARTLSMLRRPSPD
ncbi:MAG: zitB [Thermoleophilia bacterium]|nr:zitB [Thermoleophilia bacterium]MCZ4496312.1 zitB [Thermoleophilia bacterium]